MKKRKLFSNSDGSTFKEDVLDISEEVKAFFNHLPLELKKLLPIAEDIVRALQNLDDMLEEGHPVNEAIEKVLAALNVDERLYATIKFSLHQFVEMAQTGLSKFVLATNVLMSDSEVSEIEAQTAIQLAVYAVKS